MLWKVFLCSICTGAIPLYILPQTSIAKTSTQVAQKAKSSDSLGCKKSASKEAIERASSNARKRAEGSLVIFDSEGNFLREKPIMDKKSKDAAEKACNDLQPISDSCWVCCTNGEIICKTGKSKMPHVGVPKNE